MTRTLWRWIVLFRYGEGDPFIPFASGRGGLDVIAYNTKKDAGVALYEAKRLYGKRNVYLQKYGPIS